MRLGTPGGWGDSCSVAGHPDCDGEARVLDAIVSLPGCFWRFWVPGCGPMWLPNADVGSAWPRHFEWSSTSESKVGRPVVQAFSPCLNAHGADP
jgi:hypothetical protein